MQFQKITKIEVQKKRKNRFSIFLDDEFALGIDQDVLLEFGLRKGLELTEQDIEKILAAENRKAAKDRALKLLSFRDRSEKELITKLKQIGFKNEIIDWVISELKRLKFIDDQKFAVSYAKSKMISKPMGEHLLKRELRIKGISEELIEIAIEKAFEEQDQFSVALSLAERQIKKYKKFEGLNAKKKLSDFLLRRGFGWDIVNEVIEHLDRF